MIKMCRPFLALALLSIVPVSSGAGADDYIDPWPKQTGNRVLASRGSSSSRIIGGETAEPGQFPYYVEFFVGGDQGLGNGALIAPQVVLYSARSIRSPREICFVCGEGKNVTIPDATVAIPNGPPVIPCGILQDLGYSGVIPADVCELIPAVTADTCGCADTDFVPPPPPPDVTLVEVGSVTKDENDVQGEIRECEDIIPHPNFTTTVTFDNPSGNNDFALCILNETVTISEDTVELVLNEFDAVPEAGEQLIVMGLGVTSNNFTNPGSPGSVGLLQFLQVPAVSNEVCNQEDYYGYQCLFCGEGGGVANQTAVVSLAAVGIPERQYTCQEVLEQGFQKGLWEEECDALKPTIEEICGCVDTGYTPPEFDRITENMICAGGDTTVANACRGDTGGPLIKRTSVGDGRFQDVHVGLWAGGDYLCVEYEEKPGIFSRTSSAFDWIKQTVCEDRGLEAKFCDAQSSANTKGAKKTKKEKGLNDKTKKAKKNGKK